MPTVETVRGPLELEDLGRTLMHEHIVLLEEQRLVLYTPMPEEDTPAKLARLLEQ